MKFLFILNVVNFMFVLCLGPLLFFFWDKINLMFIFNGWICYVSVPD